MKNPHGAVSGAILTLTLALMPMPAYAQARAGASETDADAGRVLGRLGATVDEASTRRAFAEATLFDLDLNADASSPAGVGRAALAQAGTRNWFVGVRGGAYFDVDEPFVGVEVLLPLIDRVWFNPNFEWVFVDRADLYTINLDVHYDLPTSGDYSLWLGGGLALRRFDAPGPIEADTDPGLNLLAGLGFGHGGLVPYVQFKALIDDNDAELVLAGGIRF